MGHSKQQSHSRTAVIAGPSLARQEPHRTDCIARTGCPKRLLTQNIAVCVQVGRLWTSLADYYIRRGLIEKARDVYEEGLTTVTTVRDFSLIFDTLTQVLTQASVH